MFRRNLTLVWLGILLLSGMFLLGQQSWAPQECLDNDEDGYGNPASPLCTHSGLDCDDDPTDDPSICTTCTCGETECAPCARCIHPGATEGPYGDPTCSDTLDNDCDGIADTPDDGCVKGIILDQELDVSDKGYTVMRVWGSHYEMGYAHASLLRDCIVDGVAQFKQKLGSNYSSLRSLMAVAVWQPPEIEDEFDGMVDLLAVTHPPAGIDKLDLKVANAVGDWGSACRSHICWGRYVEEPVKTLATRRLDYGTPIPEGNHHVLCAWDPDDGSPEWVNLGWSGYVTVVTAVNEFGTLVSLHDNTFIKDLSAGRMSRTVAARHALTFPAGPDLSTHLADVFAELQGYEIMTQGFVNYYTPEGHGGVMTANPYETGPDFYHLRVPQTGWHHGEAMITTNAWTDGTYTPPDENFGADAYYNDESSPKTLASHWDLLATEQNPQFLSLHMLSVAYRGRGDMTLWADGRLDGVGRTPRLEWEWSELFDAP